MIYGLDCHPKTTGNAAQGEARLRPFIQQAPNANAAGLSDRDYELTEPFEDAEGNYRCAITLMYENESLRDAKFTAMSSIGGPQITGIIRRWHIGDDNRLTVDETVSL